MKTIVSQLLVLLAFLVPFAVGTPLNWTTTLGVLLVYGSVLVGDFLAGKKLDDTTRTEITALREQVAELEKRVNSLQTVTSMRTAFRGGKRGET